MTVADRILFSFNSSESINWVIAGLLAVLLGIQIWLIVGNNLLSGRRKGVRLVLNLFLWLVLTGYFLDLQWIRSGGNRSVLIADQNVPVGFLNRLKDSLNRAEAVRVDAFKKAVFRNELTSGQVETVTLVGSDFSPDQLGQLSQQTVRWIPNYRENNVQALHWKGMVRNEELQTISGTIQSLEKQFLKARFGRQTLDSLELQPGFNSFQLQFPVFSQGHAAVELVLNETPLDTIRFFVRKPEPVSYQFILDSPDFESKTLADWLGKQGYSVQMRSVLSKEINSTVRINRAESPDVFITDPANASHPVIRKAVAQGKPVLFMNGTDPEADSKVINRALGTHWQVRKISNESAVSLGNGLQALPFQFRETPNQFGVQGYPVAVQKSTAKIGFSLLSETFPLKLSGDSVAYERIWKSILTQLQPEFRNNVRIDAPVFAGLRSPIYLNNILPKTASVRINVDTVQLDSSPINGRSAAVSYVFGRSGWQTFQDSLAIYVQKPGDQTGYGSALVSAYVRARSTVEAETRTATRPAVPVKVPEWVWFMLFLGCLTALWLEPKFSI